MFAFLTCYLQCNLINHNMNYNLGVDLKSRSILKRYVEVGYGNKKDWEEESVTLSERALCLRLCAVSYMLPYHASGMLGSLVMVRVARGDTGRRGECRERADSLGPRGDVKPFKSL